MNGARTPDGEMPPAIRPLVPVILAGGAGERLWPLSRANHPKPFIALLGDDTLLQATARRLAFVEAAQPPIVVCNEAHRFTAAEQLRAAGVSPGAIVLEPTARGTAPAIAAAALEALARCEAGDDPVLLVLPSDHVVRDGARFADAVRLASREAQRGRLVTFGVVPTRAEAGYGYIFAGEHTGAAGRARPVARFREKPSAETAAAWVAAGGCNWNSGMFVFGARSFLHELETHAPSIRNAVEEAHANATPDLEFLRLNAQAFGRSPADSVDCAVMERTSNAWVVPLDADWRDVGSWASLAALSRSDEAGNVIRGDAVTHRTRDTLIHAGSRLVASVGVKDLLVVDTPDAVLVAHRSADQDVRAVVRRLERDGRDEHRTHRRVPRPWGSYDTVHEGDGFKVKHITVRPGRRLSLQSHRRRSEHWIVVRGVARVTRDAETFLVRENESTFIPRGVAHRLENPGEGPLELVEVQTGDYLGEDDIVRFDDDYGRITGEDEAGA